jgi:hypothetical protein
VGNGNQFVTFNHFSLLLYCGLRNEQPTHTRTPEMTLETTLTHVEHRSPLIRTVSDIEAVIAILNFCNSTSLMSSFHCNLFSLIFLVWIERQWYIHYILRNFILLYMYLYKERSISISHSIVSDTHVVSDILCNSLFQFVEGRVLCDMHGCVSIGVLVVWRRRPGLDGEKWFI